MQNNTTVGGLLGVATTRMMKGLLGPEHITDLGPSFPGEISNVLARRLREL